MAQPVVAPAIPGLAGSAATRFRVGMTMPVDPSPFVLAAGLTKVQPPEGGGMVSVEVVGVLRDGAVMLHRLYLPGGKAFFQLHLGGDVLLRDPSHPAAGGAEAEHIAVLEHSAGDQPPVNPGAVA